MASFRKFLSESISQRLLRTPNLSQCCNHGWKNFVARRTLLTEIKSVEEFKAKAQQDRLVVVQYSASWCGPCRQMKPIVTRWSNEMEDVDFLMVDVDNQNALAEEAGIESVPTFVLLKKGETVDKIIGANADKLKGSVDSHR